MKQNHNNIRKILWRKRPNVAEIEMTLFENCDVNCSFCGHEKEATVGMTRSEMLSKLLEVDKFLDEVDEDIENIHLHLLGGELFQDRLITEEKNILDDYLELLRQYVKICESKDVEPVVVIVTGNLFTKTDEIKAFYDEVKSFMKLLVIVSYDLFGRPITNQYKKNIEIFEDYISNINIVSTSQTINKIIREKNEYFDYLYDKFPIHIDDFLPDKESEYMIPSDTDLLNLMIFCYNKYPNISPFKDSIEAMKNENDGVLVPLSGSTFNKCTILPNGKRTNYIWDRHVEGKADNFTQNADSLDSSDMIYNFIVGNNCLSCQYYEKCHFRCPVLWSWKNRETNEECVNKEFYNYIVSRKQY